MCTLTLMRSVSLRSAAEGERISASYSTAILPGSYSRGEGVTAWEGYGRAGVQQGGGTAGGRGGYGSSVTDEDRMQAAIRQNSAP